MQLFLVSEPFSDKSSSAVAWPCGTLGVMMARDLRKSSACWRREDEAKRVFLRAGPRRERATTSRQGLLKIKDDPQYQLSSLGEPLLINTLLVD